MNLFGFAFVWKCNMYLIAVVLVLTTVRTAVALSVRPVDWIDLRGALFLAGVVNTTNSFEDYARERRLGILVPPECPFDGPGWLRNCH